MANNLSDFLENRLLDHSLGTSAYTMPAQLYLALFTTDPTDAGGGVEVSGGAYTRQAINFNASANGQATNATDILFPVATAAWGDVGFIGLFDAQVGGNLLWHGASTSKTINTDDQWKVSAGNLSVTLG